MSRQAAAPEIAGLSYLGELGSGGYSDVYLYEMRDPPMEVAVKVMNADALEAAARDQFTSEAKAMAELHHHPHIVQVFQAGVAGDGRPYIVMRYYPSPNHGLRAKAERFDVAEVLSTGIRIASAIETAHRAGILHRDIKPANILSDQYGNPALTDFGIAAIGEQSGEGPEGMSLPWAPPEVVFGSAEPDRRSDVYSLAATLWHLLAGRSPFEDQGGDNTTLTLMRRIKTVPPPSTGRADVPPSLERLLQIGMSKDPADRPSSAADFARALQAIEQEERLPVTPLVLAGDRGGGAPRRTTAEPGADDTRIRAPKHVQAQPRPPAPHGGGVQEETVRRGAAAAGLITSAPSAGGTQAAETGPRPRERARVFSASESALDGTVRRPAKIAEPAPTEEPPEDGGGVRRRWLLAALGLVVAAAAAGAVLLSTGGKTPSSAPGQATGGSPQTTGGTRAPTVVVGKAAPGTPVVQAKRIDSRHVRFTWAGYANALRSDSFRWRLSGTGHTKVGVSTKPDLLVTTPKGVQMCLAVQVVRRDGSAPSNLSDPTCSRQ